MGRAHDTFSELDSLLQNEGVEDVLVASSGDVFLGSESSRRPHAESLTPNTVVAVADALAQLCEEDEPGGSFEVESENGLWTVLRPPLSTAVSLVAQRIPRIRRELGDFVESGAMTSEVASTLVTSVRAGKNIVIASGERRAALGVLDALLSLPPQGQVAFFLGDARSLDDNGLPLSVLDRRSLGSLTPGQARTVKGLLRDARWVFTDRLGQPDDLAWWFGGDIHNRGRVGVVRAFDVQQAVSRVQMLHRGVHQHREELQGLLDAVLFVEQKRGADQPAMTWHQLNDASAVLAPRPQSSVVVERPATTATSPQKQDQEVSGTRPLPEHEDDPMASRTPSSSGLRPAPELSDVEPDFSLTSDVYDAPDEANVDSSLSRAVSSAFDDFNSEIFSLEDGQEQPREPRTDDNMAPPTEGSGLFGPGELDDVLDSKDSEPVKEPSGQRPPPRRSGASASRYNAETTRNDAAEIRARRSRRKTTRRPGRGPQPPQRKSTPEKNQPPASSKQQSELTRPRARYEDFYEPSPESSEKWEPAQPQVGRQAATRAGDAEPQMISSSDIEVLAEEQASQSFQGGDMPTTDLAAASPRQQRSFDSGQFMQEGILDEDEPFADEPTRRAQWNKNEGSS